ncbi:MAG: hypothetical protein KAT86_04260, partial [Candidatus Latescibacteria bacterium]|nr:hypothetical protein [Candidatus Latescibacterota bacterium]
CQFSTPFHFLDVQNVGEAHHVRDFAQGLKLLSDLIDRVPRLTIKYIVGLQGHHSQRISSKFLSYFIKKHYHRIILR